MLHHLNAATLQSLCPLHPWPHIVVIHLHLAFRLVSQATNPSISHPQSLTEMDMVPRVGRLKARLAAEAMQNPLLQLHPPGLRKQPRRCPLTIEAPMYLSSLHPLGPVAVACSAIAATHAKSHTPLAHAVHPHLPTMDLVAVAFVIPRTPKTAPTTVPTTVNPALDRPPDLQLVLAAPSRATTLHPTTTALPCAATTALQPPTHAPNASTTISQA